MWGRCRASLTNRIGRSNNIFCLTNSYVFRHTAIRLSGDIKELCHICRCIMLQNASRLSSVGSAKLGGTECYTCHEQEKLSLPKLNSRFIALISHTRRSFKQSTKRRSATNSTLCGKIFAILNLR